MNIAVKILKVVLLFCTAFFALWLDLFGGIATIVQNTHLEQSGMWTTLGVMMIIVAALYMAGTVLVMLDKSLIAAIISIIATVILLVLYGMYAGYELEGAYTTYAKLFEARHLPSVFITIFTVVIAFLANFKAFFEYQSKKKAEKYAPSIFGSGEVKAEEEQKPAKRTKTQTKKAKRN